MQVCEIHYLRRQFVEMYVHQNKNFVHVICAKKFETTHEILVRIICHRYDCLNHEYEEGILNMDSCDLCENPGT